MKMMTIGPRRALGKSWHSALQSSQQRKQQQQQLMALVAAAKAAVTMGRMAAG
jgi:hypothetical protein